MKNTFVHVEVLDKSMNAEYIVAIPFDATQSSYFISYADGYYTRAEIGLILGIPGSFIVRQRKFENERIS